MIEEFYWDFNQKMHLFEFKDFFSTNSKWKLEYATNFINFFKIINLNLINKKLNWY
jgi:hypothetical protein